MGFLTRDDFIMIDFSRFRDCRLVKAEDAQGRPCEGIFIPFRQNFIHFLPNSGIPAISLRAFQFKDTGGTGGTHILCPVSSKQEYEELVRDGLLEPGLTQWSPPMGRIYSFSKAKAHKEQLRKERKPIYDKKNRGSSV